MSTQKPLIVADICAFTLRIEAIVTLFLGVTDIVWTLFAVDQYGIYAIDPAFTLGRYQFPGVAADGLSKIIASVILLVVAKLLIKSKASWEAKSQRTFNVFWTVIFLGIALLFLMLGFLLNQAFELFALL